MDCLLHLGQHIGEVHAWLGVVSKHIGQRWLTRRIEVPIDVAEMDDARRDQVNGRVLEVLVEVVVVAVADDCVRDGLGVGNLVIGLPANLGQRVVAATLEGSVGANFRTRCPIAWRKPAEWSQFSPFRS